MTVSVAVQPQTEARLQQLAQQAGKDINSYVAELIERAAAAVPEDGIDSPVDFDNAIDELFAADGRKLPTATLTYSRDGIYLDHG